MKPEGRRAPEHRSTRTQERKSARPQERKLARLVACALGSLRCALLVLGLAAAGIVSAAPMTLTLEQAKEYALTHSTTLAQGALDVEKAQARIGEALSGYYPTIATQGAVAYLSDVAVLNLPGYPFPVPLGSHANYDARLTLTQALYTGGRLSNGYKLARIGKTLSEQSIRRKRQELVYDVHRAFINVVLMKEMLKLTQQGLDRANDHLKVVQTLFDEGMVARYDLLRTSVQVDNLKPQIAKLENGTKLALEYFKLTIGMRPDQEVELVGELDRKIETTDPVPAIEQALTSRIELQTLSSSIQATRLSRELTRANYLPTLGAMAAYDLKRPVSLGSTGWGPSLTFTLGLNYTLFDGLKTRSQLQQADLDIRKLELAQNQMRAVIITEVKEAAISMQTAAEGVRAAEANIKVAEEGLKLSEARYQSGSSSNLDVLDAQLALFQAQVNQLTAIKDYDEAHARLIKAIGKEE